MGDSVKARFIIGTARGHEYVGIREDVAARTIQEAYAARVHTPDTPVAEFVRRSLHYGVAEAMNELGSLTLLIRETGSGPVYRTINARHIVWVDVEVTDD